jgi:flagellar hook assembly protein FlgD
MVHGPIHTTLTIYNIVGQKVRTLVNEPKEPGTYGVTWDTKDENGYEVASGVYFYMLEAEDLAQTKRMVLIN